MSKNIFLIIFLISPLLAESQQRDNVVVSCQDSTVIPYVHIYISELEEFIGTVSNINGQFLFDIPEYYEDDTIIFSCLGYSTQRILVKDLKKTTCLKENSLELNTVTIKDISALDFFLKVISKKRNNYYAYDGYSKGYYWNTLKEDDHVLKYNEAHFSINNVHEVPFTVDSVFTNIDSSKYKLPILTGIENVFYFDLIRSETGVFNMENLSEWSFQYENFGGKDITVIKANRIDNFDYSYTLYINNKDYAIIKMEYKLNYNSRKYFSINSILQYSLNYVKGEILYEKVGNGYKLKFLDMHINASVRKVNEKKSRETKYFSELIVTSFHQGCKKSNDLVEYNKQVVNLNKYCDAIKHFKIEDANCK